MRSSEIRAYGRFDGFYYPRGIKHNPLINSNKSYEFIKHYILTEIKVNVVEKHYYGLFWFLMHQSLWIAKYLSIDL